MSEKGFTAPVAFVEPDPWEVRTAVSALFMMGRVQIELAKLAEVLTSIEPEAIHSISASTGYRRPPRATATLVVRGVRCMVSVS